MYFLQNSPLLAEADRRQFDFFERKCPRSCMSDTASGTDEMKKSKCTEMTRQNRSPDFGALYREDCAKLNVSVC